MANIKSKKKRILTNEKSRQRNVAVRSRIKTEMKKVDDVLETKDAAKIQAVLQEALSVLDRAATKGIIHPRAASRKKSHLQKDAHNALYS
jgi:small subunit ribosomal protein S20